MANPPAKEAPKEEPKADAKAPAAAGGGGIKPLLPLIITVVLMPVLAYAMTAFVLLPKLRAGLGAVSEAPAQEASEPASGEHGGGHGGGGHGGGGHGSSSSESGKKIKVPISKLIVNVNGSLGTRLLVASFTLVGSSAGFKEKIEEHQDQIRDLANTTLSAKTITDLEKPESRNMIRSELLSQFNSALGAGTVQEIFITELAIQ